MKRAIAIAALSALLLGTGTVAWGQTPDQSLAQTGEDPAERSGAADPSVGPETGLPLPRYVSLKSSRTYARRGPSDSHRIDWVYNLRDLPLRVTGEFDRWRRVEDSEGQGGWISFQMLSGVRTLLITTDMAPMRTRPAANAPEVAQLERGVVGRISECNPDWCEMTVDGTSGWVERSMVWGIDPGETLD